MALCSSACAVAVPRPLGGDACTAPSTRNGGISNIIFLSCDVYFKDVTNCEEWLAYVKDGKIVSSLEVLGQKPKATATRKKVASCRPEGITGFDYSVTFQDYNADNEEFADFDFWNQIQSNYNQFKVGFITCDGCIYGFVPDNPNDPYGQYTGTFIDNFTIEVSQVIEDDFNGSSYWDGTIEWKGKYETKPFCNKNIADVVLSNGAVDCTGGGVVQPDCVVWRAAPAESSTTLNITTVSLSLSPTYGACAGKIEVTAQFNDITGDAYLSGEIFNILINGTPGLIGSIVSPQSPLNITFQYDNTITPATDVVSVTVGWTSLDPACCFTPTDRYVYNNVKLLGAPAPLCISDPSLDQPVVLINDLATLQLSFDAIWSDLEPCGGDITFTGMSSISTTMGALVNTTVNGNAAPQVVPASDGAVTIVLTFNKLHPDYTPGELMTFSIQYATGCCVTGFFTDVQFTTPECISIIPGVLNKTVNVNTVTVELPLIIDWGTCTDSIDLTAAFTDIVGDAYTNGEITGIFTAGNPGLTGTANFPSNAVVQFTYDNTVTPPSDEIQVLITFTNTSINCCLGTGQISFGFILLD